MVQVDCPCPVWLLLFSLFAPAYYSREDCTQNKGLAELL